MVAVVLDANIIHFSSPLHLKRVNRYQSMSCASASMICLPINYSKYFLLSANINRSHSCICTCQWWLFLLFEIYVFYNHLTFESFLPIIYRGVALMKDVVGEFTINPEDLQNFFNFMEFIWKCHAIKSSSLEILKLN